MKARYVFAVILPTLVAATGFAQRQPPPTSTKAFAQDGATLTGVWRGQLDGLPWATLTLTNQGGILSGAIVFYLHRKETGGELTSTVSVPEPLLNPRVDGNVLTFAVSHRHAHAPGSLTDSPIQLRMELTGRDHAKLVNRDDSGASAELVRSDD